MGPQGMADLGETLLARTRYAQLALGGIDGVELSDAPCTCASSPSTSRRGLPAQTIIDELRRHGIEPGVAVGEHRCWSASPR